MNRTDLISAENAILKEIRLSKLGVGETIPSVRALQDRLNISKNLILAALQTLSEKGILRKGSSPRQGYTLSSSVDSVLDANGAWQELTVQYLLPFSTWNYATNKYLSSFESVFSKQGISLLFGNTHHSVEEERRLLESITAKAPSARPNYLLITTCDSVENPNIDLLRTVNETIPVILIDRYLQDEHFHYIGANNGSIGTRTARYLLDKGHTNIAYIRAYEKISTIQDRFWSLYNTYAGAGITIDQENIFSLAKTTVGSVSDIQTDVDRIGARILSLEPRPTAVVCSFDRIAVAIINYFRANNVRVPEDICVIGCDGDIDVAALSPVSLTTFRHSYGDCAKAAIQVIEQMENGEAPAVRATEFYSEFVLGGSSEEGLR